MNRHREVIYARRRKALAAESLRADILVMIRKEIEAMVKAHTDDRTNEINHEALREAVKSIMPVNGELSEKLGRAHSTELADLVMSDAEALYDQRTEAFTPPVMAMAERYAYINALDRLWIEHLEAMDNLRNGIGLRAIGQRDPLVEYKREGFRMFKQTLALLDADVATTIFKLEVRREEALEQAPVETALTRAAEQASTNAGVVDGVQSGSSGGSRSTRRAAAKAVRPVGAPNPAKKRKKRR
jgi:preprotein translocase subunit SecA